MTPDYKQSCVIGSKRKAEDEAEQNKENARPESASKSRKLEVSGKEKIDNTSQARDDEEATRDPKIITEGDTEETREHTPGRDGPIKEERRSASPDIKPFKGPPGKKVRKTAHEKNEEYKQFIRENEGHMFHEYDSYTSQPAQCLATNLPFTQIVRLLRQRTQRLSHI